MRQISSLSCHRIPFQSQGTPRPPADPAWPPGKASSGPHAVDVATSTAAKGPASDAWSRGIGVGGLGVGSGVGGLGVRGVGGLRVMFIHPFGHIHLENFDIC